MVTLNQTEIRDQICVLKASLDDVMTFNHRIVIIPMLIHMWHRSMSLILSSEQIIEILENVQGIIETVLDGECKDDFSWRVAWNNIEDIVQEEQKNIDEKEDKKDSHG